MADTTTIQVSHLNRDALLALGRVMMDRHPELWSSTPSFNAVVGYALAHQDVADVPFGSGDAGLARQARRRRRPRV